MDTHISRRRFLAGGGSALLKGAALAGLGAPLLPATGHGMDWKSLRELMGPAGFGMVNSLIGEASADGRPLSVGSRIDSGARIEVSPAGRLIVNMSDRSVFQFTGPATLDLLLSMMREGVLNLLLGALLAIVPSGNRYLVMGPMGAVGIKGTVFYREVFAQEQTTVHGMEGDLITPKGVRGYFCNCNGEVEYLERELNQKPLLTDRSQYHHSYYLTPAPRDRLIKAPMVNHNDGQIKALIALQEGKKHDASWIERYHRKM